MPYSSFDNLIWEIKIRTYSKRISAIQSFTAYIINFSFFGLKYKRQVIIGFVLFTILPSYYVTRVYVQDSWESCFSNYSSFSQNNDKTNRLFNGIHTLLISFETDSLNRKLFSDQLPVNRNDYLLFPEVLNEETKFESFLKNIYPENKGQVAGFTEQMSDMNFLLNYKQEDARHIGASADENHNIFKYYELIMGKKELYEKIDSARQSCLIQFFIKRPDYKNVPILLGMAIVVGYLACFCITMILLPVLPVINKKT